jgi:hypothetical protein
MGFSGRFAIRLKILLGTGPEKKICPGKTLLPPSSRKYWGNKLEWFFTRNAGIRSIKRNISKSSAVGS